MVPSCSGGAGGAPGGGGVLSQAFVVLWHDAVDLRLLQHDLGDQDVVRVVRLAPRQIPSMSPVPGEQPLAKAAALGWGGNRVRRRGPGNGHRIIRPVKIYTRTGDAGETSFFDGTRVRKNDARVDAYGEVHELHAWLGFARSSLDDPELDEELGRIQRDLFALGAQLADPADKIADRVSK